MKLNRVSIIFTTSNVYLLNFYIHNLKSLILLLQIPAHISGPYFLTTRTHKYVMLKSIHIYKKAGISLSIKSYKFGLLFNKVLNFKQVLYFVYFLSVYSPLGLNIKIKYLFAQSEKCASVSFLRNRTKLRGISEFQ